MRGGTVVTSHPPTLALERYVASASTDGRQEAAWAVESHLESCAECRGVLVDVVERSGPPMTVLLLRVEAQLTEVVGESRQSRARGHRTRWTRAWTAPATLPRVLTTLLVVAAAVALDLADAAADARFPSLVLLAAPVAPLAAVSAAWCRRLDPAYEVVAASARAGLDLVLRRTLAVLAVVIPALTVAGAPVGVSPARWLLPCLAFTAGALALGEVVGLRQAARALAAVWLVAVVGPSLWLERTPVVLDAAGRPAWLAALVVAAALLVVRRHTYTRPAGLH
jgi:hypothetical protein